MKLIIALFFIMTNPFNLIDFDSNTSIDNWNIVNDVVMGGRSKSDFFIDTNGNAIFKGTVSLDNNGGFCSVQHYFNPISLNKNKLFSIRLKGDGKKYQFRVKSDSNKYYNYIYEFQTSKEWETIEIPISEMYASYRGRTLDIPNYDGSKLSEIAFLIGNKKAENFELQIDKIDVK